MLPYLIILFVVYFLLSFAQMIGERNKPNILFLFLSGAVLVVFAGFRSSMVGTDTGNYVFSFDRLRDQQEAVFDTLSSLEKGYLLLQNFAFGISNNYWALLSIIALVVVAFNYYSTYKLSKNFKLSIFLFITLAFYLFFFNGARQGIAASIYSVALIHLINRKFLKYIIWVFIASTFHRTVLIMLPFYFMLNHKLSLSKIVFYSVLSFISLYLLSYVLNFFESSLQERYLNYSTRDARGGYLLAFFYTIMAILFIILRKSISKENIKNYNIFLNMSIFSALIYLVVVLFGKDVNFIRLTLYFYMSYILIWPIIYSEIAFFRHIIIKLFIGVIHIVYFIIYLKEMSSLIPYQLNPQFQ